MVVVRVPGPGQPCREHLWARQITILEADIGARRGGQERDTNRPAIRDRAGPSRSWRSATVMAPNAAPPAATSGPRIIIRPRIRENTSVMPRPATAPAVAPARVAWRAWTSRRSRPSASLPSSPTGDHVPWTRQAHGHAEQEAGRRQDDHHGPDENQQVVAGDLQDRVHERDHRQAGDEPAGQRRGPDRHAPAGRAEDQRHVPGEKRLHRQQEKRDHAARDHPAGQRVGADLRPPCPDNQWRGKQQAERDQAADLTRPVGRTAAQHLVDAVVPVQPDQGQAQSAERGCARDPHQPRHQAPPGRPEQPPPAAHPGQDHQRGHADKDPDPVGRVLRVAAGCQLSQMTHPTAAATAAHPAP